MTTFSILAAAMCALALAFLLPPLLRRRETPPDARGAANAAIYREQFDELGAELQRGTLTREEYERACREVERRVLAEHTDRGPVPATHRPRRAVAVVLGLLLPLVAGLGYWKLGNPDAITGVANEAGHMVSREQMEGLVEKLAARLDQNPQDAEGWVLLGRSLVVLGKHERGAQAYAKAVALVPDDAGLLADYADVLAMSRGSRLAGEPAEIVQRALKVDPQNVKALALAGTAEFDALNYAGAIAYWERILKIVPAESEFARSVAGSIDEARSRGGDKLAKAPVAKKAEAKKEAAKEKTPQAAASATSLQGVVTLDPALAGKVSPTDTLFVLARPANGPRMPLAVARVTVAQLPYRFTLDDSMAMAPGATISSHAQVVVAARVSKSGNAITQKGDIEGTSEPVAPGANGLKIVLKRIVD